MRRLNLWGMGLFVLLFASWGSRAYADNYQMTGTLSANYYMLSETDPDTGPSQCTPGIWQCYAYGIGPSSIVMPNLGPDGLPVYNPNNGALAYGYGHVVDQNSAGEILWWSPTYATYLGSGTVSLPFASSSMFVPGQTNDLNGFLTAEFTGTFTVDPGQVLTFNLSSDDDSYLYVDGVLVDADGGVHAMPGTPYTATYSVVGTHTLTLFYADRDPTGAELDFSISSNIPDAPVVPNATPEPGTVAMLGLGMAALGVMATLRRPASSPAA